MGDSTMQHNTAKTYPQVGWPDALHLFLKRNIKICNFAKNGCSTKSFIDLGYFEEANQAIEKGDFCFIQFGHNDAKADNPLRYTSFDDYYNNLVKYIEMIKNKEAIPILLTPIYRRYFDDKGQIIDHCHLEYPMQMKKVANDYQVTLIDTCQLTKDLLIKLGDEASKRLFMNFPKGLYDNYPEGLKDNTHLRFDGAYEICKIIVEELLKINHPIRDCFGE